MRTKNEQNKWNVFAMRSATNKYTTSLSKLIILYLAFFVALPLGAREINVPTQPSSPYADSEVSTNLVLNASRTDVKELMVELIKNKYRIARVNLMQCYSITEDGEFYFNGNSYGKFNYKTT